jgi:hypothetical protein
MLPRDMIPKLDFLEGLVTLYTLVTFLRTILEMELQISSLYPSSASHGTFYLKLAYNLVQAHVWFEPMGQIFLAVRALLLPQLVEA